MPRATTKLGTTIIAETDTWETVEENVYVRRPPSTIIYMKVSKLDIVVPPIRNQRPVRLAKV